MKNHTQNDVNVRYLSADYAPFYYMTQMKLSGIVRTYFDDTIAPDNEDLEEKRKLTERKFEF